MSLGPAETLENVHLRIKMLGFIQYGKESEPKMAEAYVNELFRTPSNNVTRKLYSLILDRL